MPPGPEGGRGRVRSLRCTHRDDRDSQGLLPLPSEGVRRVRAAAITPRPATFWRRSTTFSLRKSKDFADEESGHHFFNPHSPTPGNPDITEVNGMASAFVGCQQCHGSKVALPTQGWRQIDFRRSETRRERAADQSRRPRLRSRSPTTAARSSHPDTWPNTGIGRLNLDGSQGSCSACHSRHDFSPRRARQPENCGKCHLGPDHPQKEIYEESKHGVAFRDLKDHMNLDAHTWVLGKDYTQAPTCATCHMSGHSRNDGKVTHDPGPADLVDESTAGQRRARHGRRRQRS